MDVDVICKKKHAFLESFSLIFDHFRLCIAEADDDLVIVYRFISLPSHI